LKVILFNSDDFERNITQNQQFKEKYHSIFVILIKKSKEREIFFYFCFFKVNDIKEMKPSLSPSLCLLNPCHPETLQALFYDLPALMP
jgi:hypothetical protein